MCNDVQIIGLHNDDVIVFFVDDDTYDEEYIKAEFDRSFKATLVTRLIPEHISGKSIIPASSFKICPSI